MKCAICELEIQDKEYIKVATPEGLKPVHKACWGDEV